MNAKKERTIEQLINSALTEDTTSARRIDTLQRDHQTKMAALTFTTRKFRKIGGEDEQKSNISVA